MSETTAVLDEAAPGEVPDAVPVSAGAGRPGWRRAAAWVITGLAGLLLLIALIAPNDLNKYSLGAFLRIPVEGLLLVAVVLFLPWRASRVLVGIGGAGLGLLTVLKMFDIGFFAVLYRPFDPVLDWPFVEAGVDYLALSTGKAGAIAVVIGAAVLMLALVVLMTFAALRVARVVRAHRAAARPVLALGLVWVFLAGFGVQFAPDLDVASRSAAGYAWLHVRQVPAGIRDQREFAKEVAVDPFRDVPGDQLLTSLRGKDVVLTFIESYGRGALENPELAPTIVPILDAGTERLRAAGYSARSGFVTSPIVGGGSWLAHATVQSGLRIDNQQRYRNLVTTDRLTLARAFQRAGWRTVGLEPAIIQAWPEGAFFGYDRSYVANDLGYRGPRMGYATMPDQYLYSAFEREERGKPGRGPLMAQIVTLSSHAPWAPIPPLVDWSDVGDGSIYNTMTPSADTPESIFQRNPVLVRADYRNSIAYSLNALISYIETHGDDNLVLIFLGDHQPTPFVTGLNAGQDTPITIIARDPAVLNKISPWSWQDGLHPNPNAPVFPMNEFRDRFLAAFS